MRRQVVARDHLSRYDGGETADNSRSKVRFEFACSAQNSMRAAFIDPRSFKFAPTPPRDKILRSGGHDLVYAPDMYELYLSFEIHLRGMLAFNREFGLRSHPEIYRRAAYPRSRQQAIVGHLALPLEELESNQWLNMPAVSQISTGH